MTTTLPARRLGDLLTRPGLLIDCEETGRCGVVLVGMLRETKL